MIMGRWKKTSDKQKNRLKEYYKEYKQRPGIKEKINQRQREYILKCKNMERRIEKIVDVYLEGIASSDKELVK